MQGLKAVTSEKTMTIKATNEASVLGLLLVFRTNTAYDRYWEGRKLWASITSHCRNISRLIWHLLRDEPGSEHADLAHLLIHVPQLNPLTHPNLEHIPIELTCYIAAYVAKARKLEVIDMQTQVAITNSLSGLVDCLTGVQRIKNTPIPLAYSIHLKQVVLIYLLSLPFQLVSALFYATIPVIAIASFTFFGIESIAGQIENPFGYDSNDLAIETFIAQIREEIHDLTCAKSFRDPSSWATSPIDPHTFTSNLKRRRASQLNGVAVH
ncbi:hypothetical protein HDU67_004180 [Dinochytrium kinnereticum]|nr:hypothetical protein HDU67_004180 [Dinochytrium kinnereticum]